VAAAKAAWGSQQRVGGEVEEEEWRTWGRSWSGDIGVEVLLFFSFGKSIRHGRRSSWTGVCCCSNTSNRWCASTGVSLPMRARSVTAAKAAWCSQLHVDGEVEEEEEDWRAWRWSRRRSGDIGVEEQMRGMVLLFFSFWKIRPALVTPYSIRALLGLLFLHIVTHEPMSP
jgi:hypothetical protein